jgi:regulator of protease activity HflC (stomatin/prohibitin superfamily)
LIALYVSSSLKIADQWDRAVVLRLGNFHALKGPGLFFIVPLIDRITAWIDTRTISTSFKAEKTLTTQIEIYSFLNCRSTRKHFTDLAECFLGSALWSPSYFSGG